MWRKLLTWCIFLTWAAIVAVLLSTDGWAAVDTVADWQWNIVPLGIVFLLVGCWCGLRSTYKILQGQPLEGWELTAGCLILLGIPVLVFVVLALLLSMVGMGPV